MKVHKKCYNCKFRGDYFKIAKLNHLHCEHPQYTKERFVSGELSPWDTLREWWDTCEDFKQKS
jgi:hypothetical protein